MPRYVYTGDRPASLTGRGVSILLRPHAEVDLGEYFEGSQGFNVMVARGLLRRVRDGDGSVQSVARDGGEVEGEKVQAPSSVPVSDDEVTDKIEVPRPLVDEILGDGEDLGGGEAAADDLPSAEKPSSRRKRRRKRE